MQPSSVALVHFPPSHAPSFASVPTTLGFVRKLRAHTHEGAFLGPLHIDGGKSAETQKNVNKCAFDSAHAGESGASITGPVGPLLTQPLSIPSLRAHRVGFSHKPRTHQSRVRFL